MSETANGPACTCESGDFTATASRYEGKRQVTVKGTCICPKPGFQLSLELASPGTVATPDVLTLNLVERAPGGTTIEVETKTEVEEKFQIQDKVERVEIRNLNITVPITEA